MPDPLYDTCQSVKLISVCCTYEVLGPLELLVLYCWMPQDPVSLIDTVFEAHKTIYIIDDNPAFPSYQSNRQSSLVNRQSSIKDDHHSNLHAAVDASCHHAADGLGIFAQLPIELPSTVNLQILHPAFPKLNYTVMFGMWPTLYLS